jgi:hypothetical protein
MQAALSISVVLIVGISLTLLAYVGYKLRMSAKRIKISIDPILMNSKTLSIEISSLRHSRLERQRRLESKASNKENPDK